MKKLFLGSIIIVLIGIAMIACNKEDVKTAQMQSSNSSTTQTSNPTELIKKSGSIKIVVIIKFGRKKFDCRRFGICSISVVTNISINGNYAPVKTDSKGDLSVEVLAYEGIQYEDSEKNLYIDEDIISIGPDKKTYKLPAGKYPIDPKLGEFGGYTLPLKIVR